MPTKPDMTGKELRAIRADLGLNVRDFGDLIGIDKGSVSKYENEQRPIPRVVARSATLATLIKK